MEAWIRYSIKNSELASSCCSAISRGWIADVDCRPSSVAVAATSKVQTRTSARERICIDYYIPYLGTEVKVKVKLEVAGA